MPAWMRGRFWPALFLSRRDQVSWTARTTGWMNTSFTINGLMNSKLLGIRRIVYGRALSEKIRTGMCGKEGGVSDWGGIGCIAGNSRSVFMGLLRIGGWGMRVIRITNG